mmetsp:Transcript_2379/g.4322  ORF Transcript_2379/g.4322 Transcript_2379/m.4322 type:complete len:453 (+) Transcript_2379:138-1496(+)
MDVNAPAFVPGGELSASAAEFVPNWGYGPSTQASTGLSSAAPEFIPSSEFGSEFMPSSDPAEEFLGMGAGVYAAEMAPMTEAKDAWASCWHEAEAAEMVAGQAEHTVGQEDTSWVLPASASGWVPGTAAEVSSSSRFSPSQHMIGDFDQAPVLLASHPSTGTTAWQKEVPQSGDAAMQPAKLPQLNAAQSDLAQGESIPVAEMAGEKVALDVLFPNLQWSGVEGPAPLPGARNAPTTAQSSQAFGNDWGYMGMGGSSKSSQTLPSAFPKPEAKFAPAMPANAPAASKPAKDFAPAMPVTAPASKPARDAAPPRPAPPEIQTQPETPSSGVNEDWATPGGLAERMAHMAMGFEFEAEEDGEERMPRALQGTSASASTASGGSSSRSSSRAASGAVLQAQKAPPAKPAAVSGHFKAGAPPPPQEPPPPPPAGLGPGSTWSPQHLGRPGMALRMS